MLKPALLAAPALACPLILALALALALACGGEQERPRAQAESAPAPKTASVPKTAPIPQAAPVAQAAAPHAKGERPWIDDDWANAKALALASGKPVLIDMWAPWCHTCLAMQQSVLRDATLQPFDEDFVWLAIDTDQPRNADLTAALPMSMWPTFFIVDPADLTVHARFAGAASIEQFVGFLADGRDSFKPIAQAAQAPNDPPALLRQALVEESAGRYVEAEALLVRALELATPDWPRRADTWVERLRLLRKAKRWDACVDAAVEGLPQVEPSRSASVTDFSLYARICSTEAEGTDPAYTSTGHQLRALLDAALGRLYADPKAQLSVDDRSDLLANWRALALASGDTEKAKVYALRQRDLLDEAWAEVGICAEAMTYMWPRAEVYVFLDDGAALVDDYEAMVRALPKSYEPRYRLAWLLLQLDRLDEARHQAQRAIARMYGPRKARALALLAQIEAQAGKIQAQRDAQARIIALWESLPKGQQDAEALLRARSDLDRLEASKEPARAAP